MAARTWLHDETEVIDTTDLTGPPPPRLPSRPPRPPCRSQTPSTAEATL